MNIGKLAEALAKAQGQIKGAAKDSANPFFKSKYADLASVWEACRKPLSDNDLSVVQPTAIIDGATVVRTLLMHSSGEYIEGILPIQVPDTATAQQVGSAITYARRYALASMVGVAPEDDDGNSASQAPKTASPKSNLKDQATEFAKHIDACTSGLQLTALVTKNNKLMADLKSWLPEWFDRLSVKINENHDAFRMAEDEQK